MRVLDLSRVLAGPLCTMMLGDLGADVIKVERPGTGDETRQWGPPWVGDSDNRESAYFLSINRNKFSLVADLREEADRKLVGELAAKADVVIENFAPGTLRRWELDYDSIAAGNPGVIFCTISGYGTDGPEAGRPGYDFAVQARSGWMSITGEVDGPPSKVGVAVVDVLTGQNAAVAILAAFAERTRSGRGQAIDVALFDSALAGLVNVAQSALAGVPTRRFGNAHATIVPYQAFATGDAPVVVAVGNDGQWARFCTAVGLDELADDPRFASNPSRVENREILVPKIAEALAAESSKALITKLDAAGVPCAPVRRVDQAVDDPVARERGGVWTMKGDNFGSAESIASPLRLNRTPPEIRLAPPGLGAHTAAIRERGWNAVNQTSEK